MNPSHHITTPHTHFLRIIININIIHNIYCKFVTCLTPILLLNNHTTSYSTTYPINFNNILQWIKQFNDFKIYNIGQNTTKERAVVHLIFDYGLIFIFFLFIFIYCLFIFMFVWVYFCSLYYNIDFMTIYIKT